MYKPSNALVAAMKTKPYLARIKLDDGTVIESNPRFPDDPVKEIVFRGGTTGSEDGFLLGGTNSSTVVLSLNKEKANHDFLDKKLSVELGIALGSDVEYIPMGEYYVTSPLGDDDQLTVEAYDALYAKFEREYESIPGFPFSSEAGEDSVAFLEALCARRGVAVDVSDLHSIPLVAAPDGFTERQIIGFIAALYGGFAIMDRNGVLHIRRYAPCDAHVTPDEYYDGGMEKAEYTFQAKWIKCYNSAVDLTMIIGDTTAQQGIYMESIWMTNALLDDLWTQLKNFSYTPVTEVSFFGNPLLDAGDIITLEDLSGAAIKIPVMKISHEYDGGVLTRVAAHGQAEATSSAGSVKSQIQRATVQAKKYTDEENGKLDQLELLKRLTQEWLDDALYLTADGKLGIKASAILSGILSSERINGKTLVIEDGAVISTWKVDENSIYENEGYWPQGTFMCTGSKGAYSIGGSPDIPNWVFGAGGKFGVTREGSAWLSDINATKGKIGGWRIANGALTSAEEDEYGEVSNAVYMMPDRLFYMYHQGSSNGIFTSWDNVVRAGEAVGYGLTTTITVGGVDYHFKNGILVHPSAVE